MTSRGKPPAPPADDDPADDWRPGDSRDTSVEFDATDLAELEADATTPTVGPESMPGYELGRAHERASFFRKRDHLLAEVERRGFVRAMEVVRDHMLDDGAEPAIANEIIRALAERAGVKLG